MKIIFVSNDGDQFEAMEDALLRDIALELKERFRKFVCGDDAKNLVDFISDNSRVNAMVAAIRAAVSAKKELDEREWSQ